MGVSVLTSWSESDSHEIYQKTIREVYEDTVPKMLEYGFWGMICAPIDLSYPVVKNAELRKICPGIRQVNMDDDDQIRIATPDTAIHDGADLLVMGRSFFDGSQEIP